MTKTILYLIIDRVPIALMVLGAMVLAGWGLHVPFLVRLNSDTSPWPPMSQWTAISFVLLGWAYLGKRTDRYAIWVAAFIGILSSVFLVEQLFDISVCGIDHMLSDYWAFDYSRFQGRMALGTASSFILAAVAIVARNRTARELLGSSIAAIGALHLLNFAIDPARIHSNPLSMMATHTALAFCAWGIYLAFGGHDDAS
jgi:hypothetical protein